MDDPRDAVYAALSNVIDPEVGLDVVTMGLIYGVDVSDKRICVRMTLTSPGCPMGEALHAMAVRALRPLAAGRDVSVDIVFDPPWSPDLISEEGRRALRR